MIRTKPGVAFDYQLISQAVGLPVQGIMPEVRGTAAATELGRLLDAGGRRSVQRFTEGVLAFSTEGFP